LDVNHESETRTKARQGGLAWCRKLAEAIRLQTDVQSVETPYVQRQCSLFPSERSEGGIECSILLEFLSVCWSVLRGGGDWSGARGFCERMATRRIMRQGGSGTSFRKSASEVRPRCRTGAAIATSFWHGGNSGIAGSAGWKWRNAVEGHNSNSVNHVTSGAGIKPTSQHAGEPAKGGEK